MIKVGIVGASGYTGAELVRLLNGHPEVKIVAATSETFAGQKLTAVYPALGSSGETTLTKLAQTDLSSKSVDVIFLCLPHGESMRLTPELVKPGVRIIDLSGDFRFNDTSIYEAWYKHKHTAKQLAAKAVYGMPELFRDEIRQASLVANPGCYVAAAVLALYPLVKADAVETQTLIVDAKSGISGAGRKVDAETQFNRISENVIPYKPMNKHQHTPEMEMALSQATGRSVAITFMPQMIPARRGILAMAYGRMEKKYEEANIQAMYAQAYEKEPWVRLRGVNDSWPDLASAIGSNACVLKVGTDKRTGLVVAAAAIDNLIKGASGQAIQNMNLMLGWEETLGLPQVGLIP